MEDISNDQNTGICQIIFKNTIPQYILDKLATIPGYISFEQSNELYPNLYTNTGKNVLYTSLSKIQNEDVTKTIKDVNNALLLEKAQKNKCLCIQDTYEALIKPILSLSLIYSSYIEVILANSFVNNKTPIRYLLENDPQAKALVRMNYKQIHSIVSKLLGLLYEPNSVSISNFANASINLPVDANTIFERIWKGDL